MITTLNLNNLRAASQRRGLILSKRRDRTYAPGLGRGFQLTNLHTGEVVAGEKYDLTIEEVRDYLNSIS